MSFTLEYAQNHNGKFRAWILCGHFQTRDEAIKEAAARGLKYEGVDYLVSPVTEGEWE